ncbi:MAG: hypothetical protein J6K84_03215 [Oscillospiraceae bacterium]|nr:hypothetical protein [Oscillospiraceae bacterium]
MKKVVTILVVLLLCISLMAPAFAAGEDFVRSISYKDGPQTVPVTTVDNKVVVAVLVKSGEDDVPVYKDQLVITPISAVDEATKVPAEVIDTLKKAYDGLNKGTTKLPFEEYGNDAPKSPVVRDIFDATLIHDDHVKYLANEDVHIELTFRLGVDADVQVYAMSYLDGQWDPAKDTVNNGDGTVTISLDHLCPIVFAVEAEDLHASQLPEKKEDSNLMLWVILLVICAVCIVVLSIVASKKKKKKAE